MYKIVVDYSPNDQDNAIVKEGLIKSYEHIVGERDKPFSIFLKDETGKIFGGIQAFLDRESVYIDALWVDEKLRNKGYGRRLLEMAEKEAIKNGLSLTRTDTWDFEAEKFYLKCGYECSGELKNQWLSRSRIFLKKNLKVVSNLASQLTDDKAIIKNEKSDQSQMHDFVEKFNFATLFRLIKNSILFLLGRRTIGARILLI